MLVLVSLVLSLVWVDPVHAQPRDRYTISLITMSPGDPIFFRFGHNAILVRDALTRSSVVYNWGTFSFQEPGLIRKFFQGRLTYWLSTDPLVATTAHYQSENRWVLEQELNLTPEQKRRIVDLVVTNARPENATYRYHYYKDNCSTRVRDILDKALDGKVHEATNVAARFTYREHTSRLTADVWWGHFFLNLAMGSFIDQPITVWDEMFVPQKVEQVVRQMTVTDASGSVVPLVKQERMLAEAPTRAPSHDVPPRRWPWFLASGMALGAALGLAAFRVVRAGTQGTRVTVGSRLLVALPLAALTMLTGLLGWLFLFFWILTDHEVAYHNENLLQVGPWTLAFVPIAIGLIANKRWATKSLCVLVYATAGISLLGLVLKVLPWFDQVNLPMIAAFLPLWAGLAIGCWTSTHGFGFRSHT